jgi:succinate dehydrogenase / fumarate reductase cytochrome b subunit
MSYIKTTLAGYTGYRGREGQWAFLLHRISGLGVVLFLAIHIVDTSFVYFAPSLYEEVLNVYRSTIFSIGEMGLVFCLLFHGVNGLRIAYLDLFAPKDWTIEKTRNSARVALIIALVLWVPSVAVMAYSMLKFNFGMFGGA